MRQTKVIFFLILVVITGALIYVIVSEDQSSNTVATDSPVVPANNLPSAEELIKTYQVTVEKIFADAREALVQQTTPRPSAVTAIREQLLALNTVPKDLQNVHFQLVIALSKDINGQLEEAKKMYQELEKQAQWLSSSLDYLIK